MGGAPPPPPPPPAHPPRPAPPQDAKAKEAEMKDVPSLDKLLADIKEEPIDMDDKLEEGFKAEAISAETVVLNEEGKKMKLPGKK
jgi:hypothetical protein